MSSHQIYFPGQAYRSLQLRAINRQARARAAGTKRNHKFAVGVYLAFCCRLHIQPYDVSYQDLCVFIEYIAQHTPAPATVRNKISSLRVHFNLMDMNLSALNHPRVLRALEALERDKDYVPRIKQPIEPAVFYHILSNIPYSDYGYIFRAAILTLYYGALRQSELLPRSASTWDPCTQPTRGDCTFSEVGCNILIKKGKNMQKSGQYRVVTLQYTRDVACCPVRALLRTLQIAPTVSKHDPLLMFPRSRRPVPASYTVRNRTLSSFINHLSS